MRYPTQLGQKWPQRYITRSKTHCSYLSVWSTEGSRCLGQDCECIRMDAWLSARFGRTTQTVCSARLGRDACAYGRIHGSVVTHGLVVHGLNFYGWYLSMWLNFRNWIMQLKMEAMQLKVGIQNNIWGKRIKKQYMFTLFFSSFFFTEFYSLLLAN